MEPNYLKDYSQIDDNPVAWSFGILLGIIVTIEVIYTIHYCIMSIIFQEVIPWTF